MNLNLQRRLDRRVGVPLCRLVSFFTGRKPPTPAGRRHPTRILIILLSEMGSLILADPMLRRLQSRYPRASIFVLVFEQNKEALELMERLPASHIWTLDNRRLLAFGRDCLRTLRRMRRAKINAVIDCELFARISSLLSALSGAALRAGFHPHTQEGLYRGGHINCPVLYNPYVHISEQFVTLADALDSSCVPRVKRTVTGDGRGAPRIALRDAAVRKFGARLRSDHGRLRGRDLVLLYPSGGILPLRAWPLANFEQVALALVSSGYAVGVTGMQSDRPLAEAIQTRCAGGCCIDLTGYTRSLRELLMLFRYARLLITNDGGPGHLAALVALPSIVLFGPETPTLYAPLNPNARCFFERLSCAPCLTAYNHRNSPCDGDNRCLQAIEPDAVLRRARMMLGRSWPGFEPRAL
jgi:ADP-heptose:LPS heptosyltransferase